MKKNFIMLSLVLSANVFAASHSTISGVVSLPKDFEGKLTSSGALYVFAKKLGPDSKAGSHVPPVACVKIAHPKFPQTFEITEKNVMFGGKFLKGPLYITARYSITGDSLDKRGAIEGVDPKFPSADVGNNKLNIQLKKAL